jgi:hypothetical protein
MTSILAIDPGPTMSAWVEYRDGRPVNFGKWNNYSVLEIVACSDAERMAVESIASYGMAVGAEVFETCVWSGRFIERWNVRWDESTIARVYRKDVKLHLCASPRAKDTNVRQALIDRYGPGKELAIGRKASPGPLYGVTADVWAALAVAVTVADRVVPNASL